MQDDPTTPRLEPAAAGDAPARALGHWTAAQFARPRLLRSVQEQLRSVVGASAWDLRGVDRLDHVGAQMLWDHWGHRRPDRLDATPVQRAVLERVEQFSTAPPPRERRT